VSSEPRSVVGRLADVVFYGPLGLALEHRTLLPQLARRGRRQIALTHMIGRFTVRHGRQRLDGLVSGLAGPDREAADRPAAPTPTTAVPTNGNGPARAAGSGARSADELAIPQYDSLSAIQVVPRLDGLTHAELTQIRDYETATRSRRTILAKISQLQQ
jgi:hypothetical protein